MNEGSSKIGSASDRLDSWKEIATYLRKDVRTVQRWEKNEGLPVYRHQHDKLGSVYASRAELDSWFSKRLQVPEQKTAKTKIRLAVLPFDNLSHDPAQEYLSDGLTDEIIAELTGLRSPQLAVIARSSVIEYRDGHSVEQLRRTLGIDYVVEGSVRHAAGRVRITAQLINLRDQTQSWAQTYERDLHDVLALQAEIAQTIADAIYKFVGRPEGIESPDKHGEVHQVDPAAYDSYLKARYHLHGMSAETISRSIDYFERAIQQDRNYASAYAGLASACALLAMVPFDLLPPKQAMPKAEQAAQRALELDEHNAEAHAALALVRHHYQWDWAGAESSYKKAVQLNPSYASAHLWFSWLLLALDRRKDAWNEIDRALAVVQETDPHRLVAVQATRAAAHYFARDYQRAAEECERALELNPEYFMLHYILARSHARLGRHAKAIGQLKLQSAPVGQIPLMDAGAGLALAITGRKEEARQIIAGLKTAAQKRYVPATYFGMLYAGVGEKSEALNWLEKAYDERSDGLTWLKVDPMLDDLRADPRFQKLLQRIGLLKSTHT
jgi:TolB-like protein/Flp pilus assembly protein TadD